MDPLITAVRDIVSAVTRTPAEELDPDRDLVEAGLLDSLHALQVVGDLEREFGVVVPRAAEFELSTLTAMADTVRRLRAEEAADARSAGDGADTEDTGAGGPRNTPSGEEAAGASAT